MLGSVIKHLFYNMKNIIILNKQEQKLVETIAKQRYDSNRNDGVENKKIGPQSNEQTDKDGFGAELATAKFLNVYPDLSIQPRSGGFDLTTTSGCRVDVKHTTYENGRLIATLKKKPEDADGYFLVTGTFPKYKIVGWATSDELIRPENIDNLGHGEGYVLSQEKLHKI